MLFFINWDKLDKKRSNIYGIGAVISCLKQKYPQNKYLTYFNAGTRNSFSHYTFFFGEKSRVNLCSEIFDENPNEMSLYELIKEVQELAVLTEGFYILLKDKFNLPEVNLEMLER